ncbi:MAG: hypothetical protein ACP5Q3_15120, partial [bacterium]
MNEEASAGEAEFGKGQALALLLPPCSMEETLPHDSEWMFASGLLMAFSSKVSQLLLLGAIKYLHLFPSPS